MEAPNKRWLQFSLRTLLTLTTLVAVVLGWQASKVRMQRSAVAAVERANGLVVYGDKDSRKWPWLSARIGDAYFEEVVAVVLWGQCPSYDAECLSTLNGLPNLEQLTISLAPLSNSDLAVIAELRQLRTLELRTILLTDQSAKKLVKLKSLESLDLSGSTITDASVPALAQLKTLKHLDLSSTKLTDTGLTQLRAALPTCTIIPKR